MPQAQESREESSLALEVRSQLEGLRSSPLAGNASACSYFSGTLAAMELRVMEEQPAVVPWTDTLLMAVILVTSSTLMAWFLLFKTRWAPYRAPASAWCSCARTHADGKRARRKRRKRGSVTSSSPGPSKRTPTPVGSESDSDEGGAGSQPIMPDALSLSPKQRPNSHNTPVSSMPSGIQNIRLGDSQAKGLGSTPSSKDDHPGDCLVDMCCCGFEVAPCWCAGPRGAYVKRYQPVEEAFVSAAGPGEGAGRTWQGLDNEVRTDTGANAHVPHMYQVGRTCSKRWWLYVLAHVFPLLSILGLGLWPFLRGAALSVLVVAFTTAGIGSVSAGAGYVLLSAPTTDKSCWRTAISVSFPVAASLMYLVIMAALLLDPDVSPILRVFATTSMYMLFGLGIPLLLQAAFGSDRHAFALAASAEASALERAQFVRYWMHEVRVPMNNVHLSTQEALTIVEEYLISAPPLMVVPRLVPLAGAKVAGQPGTPAVAVGSQPAHATVPPREPDFSTLPAVATFPLPPEGSVEDVVGATEQPGGVAARGRGPPTMASAGSSGASTPHAHEASSIRLSDEQGHSVVPGVDAGAAPVQHSLTPIMETSPIASSTQHTSGRGHSRGTGSWSDIFPLRPEFSPQLGTSGLASALNHSGGLDAEEPDDNPADVAQRIVQAAQAGDGPRWRQVDSGDVVPDSDAAAARASLSPSHTRGAWTQGIAHGTIRRASSTGATPAAPEGSVGKPSVVSGGSSSTPSRGPGEEASSQPPMSPHSSHHSRGVSAGTEGMTWDRLLQEEGGRAGAHRRGLPSPHPSHGSSSSHVSHSTGHASSGRSKHRRVVSGGDAQQLLQRTGSGYAGVLFADGTGLGGGHTGRSGAGSVASHGSGGKDRTRYGKFDATSAMSAPAGPQLLSAMGYKAAGLRLGRGSHRRSASASVHALAGGEVLDGARQGSTGAAKHPPSSSMLVGGQMSDGLKHLLAQHGTLRMHGASGGERVKPAAVKPAAGRGHHRIASGSGLGAVLVATDADGALVVSRTDRDAATGRVTSASSKTTYQANRNPRSGMRGAAQVFHMPSRSSLPASPGLGPAPSPTPASDSKPAAPIRRRVAQVAVPQMDVAFAGSSGGRAFSSISSDAPGREESTGSPVAEPEAASASLWGAADAAASAKALTSFPSHATVASSSSQVVQAGPRATASLSYSLSHPASTSSEKWTIGPHGEPRRMVSASSATLTTGTATGSAAQHSLPHAPEGSWSSTVREGASGLQPIDASGTDIGSVQGSGHGFASVGAHGLALVIVPLVSAADTSTPPTALGELDPQHDVLIPADVPAALDVATRAREAALEHGDDPLAASVTSAQEARWELSGGQGGVLVGAMSVDQGVQWGRHARDSIAALHSTARRHEQRIAQLRGGGLQPAVDVSGMQGISPQPTRPSATGNASSGRNSPIPCPDLPDPAALGSDPGISLIAGTRSPVWAALLEFLDQEVPEYSPALGFGAFAAGMGATPGLPHPIGMPGGGIVSPAVLRAAQEGRALSADLPHVPLQAAQALGMIQPQGRKEAGHPSHGAPALGQSAPAHPSPTADDLSNAIAHATEFYGVWKQWAEHYGTSWRNAMATLAAETPFLSKALPKDLPGLFGAPEAQPDTAPTVAPGDALVLVPRRVLGDMREMLKVSLQGTTAMKDVANSVLDWIKVSSGMMTFVDDTFDAVHALQEVAKMYERQFRDKGVSLTIESTVVDKRSWRAEAEQRKAIKKQAEAIKRTFRAARQSGASRESAFRKARRAHRRAALRPQHHPQSGHLALPPPTPTHLGGGTPVSGPDVSTVTLAGARPSVASTGSNPRRQVGDSLSEQLTQARQFGNTLLGDVALEDDEESDGEGLGERVGGGQAVYVKADKVRIQQCMRNLVSNAFKHSPPETEVTIRMYAEVYYPSDLEERRLERRQEEAERKRRKSMARARRKRLAAGGTPSPADEAEEEEDWLDVQATALASALVTGDASDAAQAGLSDAQLRLMLAQLSGGGGHTALTMSDEGYVPSLAGHNGDGGGLGNPLDLSVHTVLPHHTPQLHHLPSQHFGAGVLDGLHEALDDGMSSGSDSSTGSDEVTMAGGLALDQAMKLAAAIMRDPRAVGPAVSGEHSAGEISTPSTTHSGHAEASPSNPDALPHALPPAVLSDIPESSREGSASAKSKSRSREDEPSSGRGWSKDAAHVRSRSGSNASFRELSERVGANSRGARHAHSHLSASPSASSGSGGGSGLGGSGGASRGESTMVYLRFEVEDKGIGMTREEMSRLFKPFSQLREGAKQAGSSGLGLTLCKAIVEHMNGGIRVHSKGKNRGSTFFFWCSVPAAGSGTVRFTSPALGGTVGSAGESALPVAKPAPPAPARPSTPPEAKGVAAASPSRRPPASGEMKAGARDVSHATAASHTTSGSSAAAKVLTSSSDVRFSASGNASIMLSGLSSRMSSGAGTPLAGAGSRGTPSMGSGTPSLSSASSAAGSTSDKGLPGSVLIVDDTAVTRQLLARVVKRTFPSTTVLVAEDGQQALRVFVEHHEAVRSGLKDARGAPLHRVSCVLMDKSMPVMDGFACANALRQQHGYSGRIVGVTGNALRQDIEDFKANGADAVLTKPVDRKLLQAAVRGALRMALEGPTPSMMQRVASGASSQ